MIFQTLYEAAERKELILINGGICHWHLRKDSQITIHEIISTRPGAGTEMLNLLIAQRENGATSIFAKCPIDLAANKWYESKGFILEGVEETRTGRKLKLWRLPL